MSYNLTPPAKKVLAQLSICDITVGDYTIASELTLAGLATESNNIMAITEAGRDELRRIAEQE